MVGPEYWEAARFSRLVIQDAVKEKLADLPMFNGLWIELALWRLGRVKDQIGYLHQTQSRH